MKQTSKNETQMLDLINKIQAQIIALDKKVDTLINRSMPQAKPSPVANTHLEVRPNDRSRERLMYKAICADCQKECSIPFKPSGDRPVYCQDCFSRRKVISMSGMKIDDKPKEAAPVPEVKAKKKAVTAKKPVGKKKLAPKKK